MHPSCLQTVSLLENSIGDQELMFGAKFNQELPIVIAVLSPVLSKNSFPSFWSTLALKSPRIMILSSMGFPERVFTDFSRTCPYLLGLLGGLESKY